MNEPFQLMTNCSFKGKDFLVQMCVLNSKKLELTITDKLMAEDWQCEYDAPYIEALTHKTGNFKQFDVFVMMLKSGLLKTSDCITLDLLTLDDLDQMRIKKISNSRSSTRTNQSSHSNKRYLILTYTVEFDRIHYPLPLEYCGPPDPSILQSNIRRLEAEVERLKQKNIILSKSDVDDKRELKEKIQKLLKENAFLSSEVQRLNKLIFKNSNPVKNYQALHNILKRLEEQVMFEKKHNHQSMIKLREENKELMKQVKDLKKSENSLKIRVKEFTRQQFQKNPRKISQLCPENLLERKKYKPGEISDSLLFHPVSKRSAINKVKLKPTKRVQNKFLSSSSSESEARKSRRAQSRESNQSTSRKPLPPSKICSRFGPGSEKSKLSSEDNNERIRIHNSKISVRRNLSKNGKRSNSNSSRGEVSKCGGIRSRDSSLSSRSSKLSKRSLFSNRGSGDHNDAKSKRTSRSILENKEELKFTMSDLETRIHALQRLLYEGLNF